MNLKEAKLKLDRLSILEDAVRDLRNLLDELDDELISETDVYGASLNELKEIEENLSDLTDETCITDEKINEYLMRVHEIAKSHNIHVFWNANIEE